MCAYLVSAVHDDKREGVRATVQYDDDEAGASGGASVTKITMADNSIAKVTHRWRCGTREGEAKAAPKAGVFIALPPPMALPQGRPFASKSAGADLHIELRDSSVSMSIT